MPTRPRRLVSEHGPLAYTDRPADPKHACECDQAEVAARHLLATVAMAREVTR